MSEFEVPAQSGKHRLASFFTFARLSLPPSVGCIDDAIEMKLTCFRLPIAIKSTHVHTANGDYRDQTKHRFRTWPLG